MTSKSSTPEDLDDSITLESKVLLALTRLQSKKKSKEKNGISCNRVVQFLKSHYSWLDGDIQSQVKTVLLSFVKNGVVCNLENSKYRLLVPLSKDMASACATRIIHGPDCCCLFTLKYINSPNICCLFKKQGGLRKKVSGFTKKPKKSSPRQCVKFQPKKNQNSSGCLLNAKDSLASTRKRSRNSLCDSIKDQNLKVKKKSKTNCRGASSDIPKNVFSPRDECKEKK